MYLLSVWDVSQPGISKHGRFIYNYSVGYRINWVVTEKCVIVQLEKYDFSGHVYH